MDGLQLEAGEVVAAREDVRSMPVFTGSGGEYFRIWIVNLLLCLLTFGFYLPWARVRTRRYFYRHTLLDGEAFDYLADPRRLLVGYLIIGAFLALYLFGDLIVFGVTLVVVLLFGLTFPWLRYKSFGFFARNSTWQNLRLRFTGRLGDAYRIYLGLMLLIPFTFGLIYPYIAQQSNRYLFGNLGFGAWQGHFEGRVGTFYAVYLAAMGIFIGLLFVVVFAFLGLALGFELLTVDAVANGGAAGDDAEVEVDVAWLPVVGLGLVFYGVPLAVLTGVGVVIRNHCWNHFELRQIGSDDARVRFDSRLRVATYLGIFFSNLLLIVLTVGMFLPWAKVRLHRYRVACLSVFGTEHLRATVAAAGSEVAAIGESASDLLDFELGL